MSNIRIKPLRSKEMLRSKENIEDTQGLSDRSSRSAPLATAAPGGVRPTTPTLRPAARAGDPEDRTQVCSQRSLLADDHLLHTQQLSDEERSHTPTSLSAQLSAQTGPATAASHAVKTKLNYAEFIDRHYDQMQPGINLVQYNITDLFSLCDDATESFRRQKTLVDVQVPITICGDIHGQFNDLTRMLATLGTPPARRYLFLGDYIDRGCQSVECICLLLAYKVLYPEHVYLLRGNHEQSRINKVYGFYVESTTRFGKRRGKKLWALFQKVFDMMPVVALVEHRIMCMHGGLSPEFTKLSIVRDMPKPISNPMIGLINDLLWADPSLELASGWKKSDRGTSFMFGPDVVEQFCHKFDLDMIVRAHQVCLGGYWYFAGRKMVTVFSAPVYCNNFENCGAVMHVSEEMKCSIKVFQPLPTSEDAAAAQ